MNSLDNVNTPYETTPLGTVNDYAPQDLAVFEKITPLFQFCAQDLSQNMISGYDYDPYSFGGLSGVHAMIERSRFIFRVIRRAVSDLNQQGLLQTASALTLGTLVALVPSFAVFFSI